jgi:hypothetical protein
MKTGKQIKTTSLIASRLRVIIMFALLGAVGQAYADRSTLAGVAEESLERGFETPPDSAKPWCYWWWLDSNVSKEGITADLEAMKKQGIVGALVFDAGVGGPNAPDGPAFMSPEWRDHLKFTLQEAERLGLEISLNLCSGWNAGGPWVTPEQAAKEFTWSETLVRGGGRIEKQLLTPRNIKNYYRDVAVHAFRISEHEAQAIPMLTASSSSPDYPLALASDSNLKSRWISNGDKPGQGPTLKSPEFLNWEFSAPFPVASLMITPYSECGPKDCEFQYSNDGKKFQTICRFLVEEGKEKSVAFDEREAKFFRLVFTSSYPYQGKDNWNVQVSEVSLLKKGQKKLASLEEHYKSNAAVDLTAKTDASGKLLWDAPKGTWKIMRMGYTLASLGHLRFASPRGGGLEIDPLSREAMDMHFDATMGACLAEMQKLIGRTLKYTHIDSWELGAPNWTPDFRMEFQRRRGYDPLPYLPALAGKVVDSKEVTGRFLHDCRRTVADCIAENYYGRLSDLSRKHGVGIHPESGGPYFTHWIDALQCLGKSDIPMGEYWARRTEPSGRIRYQSDFDLCDTVRQAASAAHIYGKRFVQAEAYTTMGPNWEKDPYMLKDVGDLAFCEGLTRNMLCFYVHQPYLDIKPGNQWEAAGTHFDRNITWFPQSHGWLTYLSRCQFLLQQGLFVADVCYYYGDDAPAFVPGRDFMKPALPGGYDCDTINTEVLLTRVSAKDGRIMLPDGMSYRMLVLPNTDAMSLPVLKKVAELVKAGVTIVGSSPTRTPGLKDFPTCDDEVKKLASKLQLVSGKNLQGTLTKMGIQPDFESGKVPLRYIHRRSDDEDIYFVSNQQAKQVRSECTFRVNGKQPEIWDAVTGEMREATAFTIADGRCTLPLEFASRGSLFVVFRKPTQSTTVSGSANYPALKQVNELAGPWTVKFDPKWGGPESVEFEKLEDWTQRPEPSIKYYSGKATYHKTFDLPKGDEGKRLYLSLNRVQNIAQVRLNGHDLGVVWTAPWQVEITKAVKAEGNKLEIDVVNLWPNRLIGDAALPPAERLTKTNVEKFNKPEHQKLLPSGLLAPVRIMSRDNRLKEN